MRGMSVSRVMPALLTRMCSLPHFSTTASTTCCTLSASVTSQAKTSAVPPAARIASTVSASLSALRATQATLAPAPARASAMARPMPREAPVTIADLAAQVDLQRTLGRHGSPSVTRRLRSRSMFRHYSNTPWQDTRRSMRFSNPRSTRPGPTS